MEISEHVLLETWELFSDFVPPGKKNDAAVRFLKIFIDADIDLDDLEELREEDEHLDYALDELASSLDEGYEDEPEYEEE